MLWLSDFFQLEEFQEKCILDVIIPRLSNTNCITYLNEAFKKLKACETSNDMWYLLLNNSMNFVARNIFWLIERNYDSLNKHINSRLGEEIVNRALMYLKDSLYRDFSPIIQYLLELRKLKTIGDLLQS